MRPARNSPRILAPAVLAACCCCVLAFAQTPTTPPGPAAPSGPYRIAGVVVNAQSGARLARTRVTIRDTKNPRDVRWLVSREDGGFEFAQLPQGKYSLSGVRTGFISAAYDQHGTFSTAIVTGPGLDSENLILRLEPAATITGKVTDEAGDPVRNAQVRLYRENHGMGVRQINQTFGSQTDDQGYYEFAPVVPGNYYVAVAARPWYAVHPPTVQPQGVDLPPPVVDPALDVAYPTTFYPGTTESQSAIPITVKGGDHAEADVQMEPVAALHLIMHVENPQSGFAQPQFQERVFDSLEYAQVDGIWPSQDTVEITGIPPGTYSVRTGGRMPGDEVRNAEMTLAKSGEISNEIRGEPLAALHLSVKIQGEDKLPPQLAITVRDSKLRNYATRAVDPKGEVDFAELPAGEYTLLANAPGRAFAVIRTSSQGVESSGNSIEAASGAAASLTAWLIGGAATVEGFAKRAGKPVAGAMIVMVPENPDSRIEVIRRDQSDSDGSFTLPAVIPGTYTVVAVEDGWALEWSRREVLARYLPHGQKVTVGAEARAITLSEPVEVQ